ncbi:nucleoid-associated protein [Clostridioides difficile]|uniref:nucleoid-associated protein n=1 Tax=Clostridioides difficile TaxID=1496 RepID=UPI001033EFA5|nr:nucleoid-associated protein [Clostridioides difficile]MDM9944108.1 nucleoid-associated protein [Clostridioides difficile]
MIINKFIVHVFDKESTVPVLSDFEGRINQESEGFLKKGLKKIIKNDNLRKGIFNEYSNNLVKQCCEQMIYEKDSFVDNSKEIASYMLETMKEELGSCNVIMCLYSYKEQEGIAIMKIDYKSVYTHSIEYEDDKFNIQVIPNKIAFSIQPKIKQAALVELSGINDEYHVRVLDIDSEKEDSKSRFIEEFINAEKIDDDTYKTKVLKKTIDKWINNHYSDDVKKAEEVKSLLNYRLLQSENIDVDEFISEIIDDEKKDSLKEELDEKNVNDNLNVDKGWIEKNINKRKMKLDNGFGIVGNISDFEDPMKYSVKKNLDGSVDIVLKNVSYIEG